MARGNSRTLRLKRLLDRSGIERSSDTGALESRRASVIDTVPRDAFDSRFVHGFSPRLAYPCVARRRDYSAAPSSAGLSVVRLARGSGTSHPVAQQRPGCFETRRP